MPTTAFDVDVLFAVPTALLVEAVRVLIDPASSGALQTRLNQNLVDRSCYMISSYSYLGEFIIRPGS